MATDTEKDPRTVQLKRVRLSFTDSLKDKKATVENGEPKYSCNLILESEDKDFEAKKAKVVAAIKASGERSWMKPDAYKSIMEDDPKRVCFRKGERFKNKEGEIYAGYEGNWGIACGTPRKGQKRPVLLDRRKKPVAEDDILDVFYGGVYADVIVSFYGTDKGGRGIFCTLEAIRSHEEGERMGGGPVHVDADDFDDLGDPDDAFEGTDGAASDDDPLG